MVNGHTQYVLTRILLIAIDTQYVITQLIANCAFVRFPTIGIFGSAAIDSQLNCS